MPVNKDGEFEDLLELTPSGEYAVDVKKLKKEELMQVLDEVPVESKELE